MLWVPRVTTTDNQVDSARLLWPCLDDSDCSFNVQFDFNDDRRCQCSNRWKGLTCSKLDLLPGDRNILGFTNVDANGHNISPWGAPILFDEVSKKWQGFASEIHSSCGINAWETNSRIVHIMGDSPHGPFERQHIVWPVFAHISSVV